MSAANGQRPPMDVNLLTPNDYRRLRAALGADRDVDTLLSSGQPEDVVQTLILGFKLREDPEFTWERAGDTAAASVFDMTGGGDAEPDPQTGGPGSPGPEAAPPAAKRSSGTRRGRASAPSSASSSG